MMSAIFSTASQTAELVKVFVTSSFTSGHILSSFVNKTICGSPYEKPNMNEVHLSIETLSAYKVIDRNTTKHKQEEACEF